VRRRNGSIFEGAGREETAMQLATVTTARRNHLRIMPQDNEPHDTVPPSSEIDREAPTRPHSERPLKPEALDQLAARDELAPPARDTKPPREMTEDQKDAEALAIRQSLTPVDIGVGAVDQLIQLYQENNRRTRELLDPNSTFNRNSEERSQRIKRETVEELSRVVDDLAGRPVRELSERLDVLSKAVKVNEAHDTEQDRLLVDLRSRLERLESLPERFASELREINSALAELSLRHDVPGVDRTLAGRVVLLVEDSQQLSRTLTRVAESRGARVQAAASLHEAEILVAQERPDVAVIDIRLSGDDGFAVAAWLSSVHHLPKARMLLMTGATGDDVKLRAGAMGLRVLTKPFGATQLVSAIQDALAQSAEAPPG